MTVPLRRIVVCESRQYTYAYPPPRAADLPIPSLERMAERFGAALQLPSVAIKTSLDQCEPSDFVFYNGEWESYLQATSEWTAERHELRARRTARLDGFASPRYVRELESSGAAFSIPTLDQDGPLPNGRAFIYARRDIAVAAGLELSEAFRSPNYVGVFALPGMPQAEMVALYLRTYWDKLGY